MARGSADLRPLANFGPSFLPKEAALRPIVTSIHMIAKSYPQLMCRRSNSEVSKLDFACGVFPVIQNCSKTLSRGGLGELAVAGMKSNKRTHTAHKTHASSSNPT